MTEKKILEKIKKSAEQVEIPEALSPSEIEKMLHKQKKSIKIPKKIIAAASVFLICGVCGIAALKTGILGQYGLENRTEYLMVGEESAGESSAGDEAAKGQTAAGNKDMPESIEGDALPETAGKAGVQPKQDAGTLYQVASGYEEVYLLLEEYPLYVTEEGRTSGAGFRGGLEEELQEGAVEDSMATGSATVNHFAADTNFAKEETAVEDISNEQIKFAENKEDYSTTNLQTQGVDESDIIKTDGKYIYTVSQNKVLITDIQGETLETVGSITLNQDTDVENILEMYVNQGKVILITTAYDTSLEEKIPFQAQSNTGYSSEGEKDAITEAVTETETNWLLEDRIVENDMAAYYIERKLSTNVYTYDVTKPKAPVLLGKVKQDGSYYTSRKIGDIVYLFTNEDFWGAVQPSAENERQSGEYLPLVNGEEIPYDCIYIPERGNQGLIISSVNVNNPSAIVDKTMILNNYVEIYVGNESCYLYNTSYKDRKDITEIAKFTFTDGIINAVDATAIDGVIYDTFAINEKNGKLRVLTTVWNYDGEQSNSLTLLDEQLALTGTLSGIAPGENIYAARYIGNIVYFITYRNMDPLFAVDISDETAPKMLGELEITGFSEYLHPWGEDKLLGVGYETDPDTGIQEGIKLVMFDISNPTELKILDTLAIENVDYCAALYNYKSVTAEENANIIGFATETYTSSYNHREINYLAFGWENGKFVNLLTEGLTSGVDSSIYRGIYVGDKFFIASPEQIRSFDRSHNYKKLNELVF